MRERMNNTHEMGGFGGKLRSRVLGARDKMLSRLDERFDESSWFGRVPERIRRIVSPEARERAQIIREALNDMMRPGEIRRRMKDEGTQSIDLQEGHYVLAQTLGDLLRSAVNPYGEIVNNIGSTTKEGIRESVMRCTPKGIEERFRLACALGNDLGISPFEILIRYPALLKTVTVSIQPTADDTGKGKIARGLGTLSDGMTDIGDGSYSLDGYTIGDIATDDNRRIAALTGIDLIGTYNKMHKRDNNANS